MAPHPACEHYHNSHGKLIAANIGNLDVDGIDQKAVRTPHAYYVPYLESYFA